MNEHEKELLAVLRLYLAAQQRIEHLESALQEIANEKSEIDTATGDAMMTQAALNQVIIRTTPPHDK